MKPARITPEATSFRKASTTRTPKTAAAIAARLIELFHVGGLSSRSVRRLRLAWAIYQRRYRTALSACLCHRAQDVLEDVPLRVKPAQRHVRREVVEGRSRREPNQLGLGHLGSRPHVFDDLAQRHRVVVV